MPVFHAGGTALSAVISNGRQISTFKNAAGA